MSVIDDRTTGQNLPLPHQDNLLADDVARLRQALTALDLKVTALFSSLDGKASMDHGHAIAGIVGLVDALASKAAALHAHAFADLSDVAVTGAGNNMVVMRQAAEWIPVLLQIGHVAGLEAALNGKASLVDLNNAVAALVNGSGAALDTLRELAEAIGSDPNFATTMSAALGNRVRVDAAQALSAPQQAQARSNLGLGSMATANVTKSTEAPVGGADGDIHYRYS